MKLLHHKDIADNNIQAKPKLSESIEYYPFLSSVCHELRAPLNAVIGFADVLKSELQL